MQEVVLDIYTKMFIGKVLGEVYKLQYILNAEDCTVGPEHIYGLTHGIETAVQAEVPTDFISTQEVRQVEEILASHVQGPRPTFRDFQAEVEGEIIDSEKLVTILTYLKANGQFSDLIQDFANEEHSPTKFDMKEPYLTRAV